MAHAWRSIAETGVPSLVAGGPADAPRVEWVSQSLAMLLHVTPGEMTDRPVAELAELEAPVGGEAGWVAAARELIAAGHGHRQTWARSLTGRDVRLLLEVTSIAGPDASGGWLVTMTPQTDEESEREHALRVARARFTALAESAPIGIFLSEVGLRLGYVNDRFVELCGRAAYQLLGTEWLGAVDEQDLPALYAAVEDVLRGRHQDLHVRLAARGDVPQWVHLRLAPVTTASRGAGFIGTAEDVTERRAWEDKITYQAQHDALTGLVNRRRLIEVLHELLVGSGDADRQFAVMFIDLDGFKTINDTRGHEVGDRVLVEVARRMRRMAREYDLVSRVAGDEFVVILRRVLDRAEAEAAARRVLWALSSPIRIGRREERISASIGVAVPGPQDTVESLLRAADQLMYEAKSSGGGGYRTACPSPIAGHPVAGRGTP